MSFDSTFGGTDVYSHLSLEELAQRICELAAEASPDRRAVSGYLDALKPTTRNAPPSSIEAAISILSHSSVDVHGQAIRTIALEFVHAHYSMRLGQYSEVIRHGELARLHAARFQDEAIIARTCQVVALGHYMQADYSTARVQYEESLIAARRATDRALEASASMSLALISKMEGDLRGSERLARQAVGVFRELSDYMHLTSGLINLGIIQTKLAAWLEAESCLSEAKSLAESRGLEEFRHSAALALAKVLRLRGLAAEARSRVESVLHSASSIRNPRTIVIAHEYLGDLLLDEGQALAASREFDNAMALAEGLDARGDLIIECLRRQAEVELHLPGDFAAALRQIEESVALARSQRNLHELAASLQVEGRLRHAAGEFDASVSILNESLRLWAELGDSFEHGRTALFLSRILADRSHFMDAVALALEARRELDMVSNSRWSAESSDWLTQLTAALAASMVGSQAEAKPDETPGPSARMFDGFVTRDPATNRNLATLAKLAPRNLNILVLGETGTGKELIAKAIHKWSERKGPFVPVNCSAIPSELIEGELFGHSRGAFTGADRDRNGLIEYSHRGTLFLDEIGDMPMRAQARLLRALESGEIRRLGENTPRIVDLRVVAATHRNLLEMVSAGQFRLDLYYRLAGYVVQIPAIREREGDAALLVDYYLEEFCRAQDKRIQLSPDLRQELARYSWPGNVREIRHVVHRLVSLAEPGQMMRRLPFELEGTPRPNSLPQALEAEEKKRVLDALHAHNWNKAKASVALGTSRTTLIGKMKRLGIPLRPDGSN